MVHDPLGREEAVLVDAERAPETFQVTFDAGTLSSGAYISRMTAGDFVATRMMTFLR